MKKLKNIFTSHKKGVSPSSGALALFSRDNKNKLTAPYSQHPAVYSCIRAKSRNVAQVPFEIFKGTNDKPEKNGALVQLFKGDVNTPQSTFFEGIVTNLDIWGSAFILQDDETTTGGLPKTLTLLPNFEVKEVLSKGVLTSWSYQNNIIPLERMIHIRYYNPYSTIKGLSPLAVLLLNVETDYQSMVYNKKFFENDGTPNNIFSTPMDLSPTQRKQLTDVLYHYQKGVDKSHRTLVMDNDVKWMGARTPNKDMEFMAGRKFTISECAMAFGVPKEALQQYEDINYATSITANRSFWEKTLIPLMNLICESINVQFLDRYGYRCEFNTSGISALAQPLAELADAATKFFNMGVPFDELNRRFNFGFAPFTDSDKSYSGKMDFTEEPTEPTKSKFYISQEAQLEGIRKAQWSEVIDKTNPFVGKLSKNLRGYFRSINQKLMKRLTAEKAVFKAVNQIDELISGLVDDEKLKSILYETEKATISAGAATVAELTAIEVEAMLMERLKMVTQINATTTDVLEKALRQSLQDSITAGLTEGETTKALIDAAEKAGTHNLKRARTIARTEVHGAFSESRHEAVKDLEPKTKTWLSDIYGDKTRDTHRAMNGETVPYNEKYSNGLMFPLDQNGRPEEVISCRCVEVYGW